MGRKRTLIFREWVHVKEANEVAGETCHICDKAWSSKMWPITPRGAEQQKSKHPPLALDLWDMVILPEEAKDKSAVYSERLKKYVMPILLGDKLTDIKEESSMFPMGFPPSRVIWTGYVQKLSVCAPCWYMMAKQLASMGFLEPHRTTWPQARAMNRGRLIDSNKAQPTDRRGYVDRREGLSNRRRVERRAYDPNAPEQSTVSEFREDSDDPGDEV